MVPRPTYEAFKAQALQREDVRKEYDALYSAYEVRKQLIALRQKSGFTQEQYIQTGKRRFVQLTQTVHLDGVRGGPRLQTEDRVCAHCRIRDLTRACPLRACHVHFRG